MKIEWFKPKQALAQGVSNTVQMSFVSKELKQCHVWVMCKDYLQDAFYCMLNKKAYDVYGFQYNLDNPPIDEKHIRIVVSNLYDDKFRTRIEGALDFVNSIANKLGIDATTVEEVTNAKPKRAANGVFCFNGDGAWMTSSPLISLFALSLRVGFGHKAGDDYLETCKKSTYYSPDRCSLNTAIKGLDCLQDKKWQDVFYTDIKKNYPLTTNMMTVHRAGICCFSSGHTIDWVPHWHKAVKKA